MNSMYYDLQEIFYLTFSPCWVVLLGFFIAGSIVLAAHRVFTALWRQHRVIYSEDNIES